MGRREETLELKLITQAPKAGMWSHIWGPSHLVVQRGNQLVNSGREWTIKTLAALGGEGGFTPLHCPLDGRGR